MRPAISTWRTINDSRLTITSSMLTIATTSQCDIELYTVPSRPLMTKVILQVTWLLPLSMKPSGTAMSYVHPMS
jgi:hypothetical protein